jgi:ketosteroid isomerase-like protein
MKKMLLLVLLVSALSGCTQEKQAPTTAARDSSLETFLPQWEAAQSRFINGDPTLWKQNASHSDDATMLGAFGGHEKGWNEVGERCDWASSHFKESGATERFEYLNTGVSGDLAFTVAIEHQEEVQMVDQDKPAPRALRVTQIFRKEDGVWKLLHRHADPLIEKKGGRAAELQRTGETPQ